MRYMLDTNVISALEKAPTGPLLTKLSNAGIDQIATSVIVAGELEYGSAKVRATRLRDNLKTLLGEIGVLPIDASVAQSYGRVRADLAGHQAKEQPFGRKTRNGRYLSFVFTTSGSARCVPKTRPFLLPEQHRAL